MRIISSLLGSLFLLLAACFAVNNRQTADISLWPFDLQIEAPLYLLTLGTLFCGILLGALVTWVGVLPHRLAARRLHKELERMNQKISTLQHSVQAVAPIPYSSKTSKWRFWKTRI